MGSSFREVLPTASLLLYSIVKIQTAYAAPPMTAAFSWPPASMQADL